MQILHLLLLFAAGCWCQMLPSCPPYAAFLPPELLVGCLPPPPFPPRPYPMMPPMMPPAIVNITMPKNHDHKTTTTPSSNNYSFHFPMPQMPMPFPPPMPFPMPMGPPMPMDPPMPMFLPPPPVSVMKLSAKSIKHSPKNNLGVTPVLSYVTRDGHVIYKKTLSDVEALRWLKKEIKKIRYLKTGGRHREDGNNSDGNRTAGEEESKN